MSKYVRCKAHYEWQVVVDGNRVLYRTDSNKEIAKEFVYSLIRQGKYDNISLIKICKVRYTLVEGD